MFSSVSKSKFYNLSGLNVSVRGCGIPLELVSYGTGQSQSPVPGNIWTLTGPDFLYFISNTR
jgi:hypothetical protein